MILDKEILSTMLEEAKKVALRNDCVNDSNFSVAAALLTKDSKIYTGHNIENLGIQSTCSERTTFSKALSEGEKEFVAILVIGYPKKEEKFVPAWPCGYCREFMSAYLGNEFLVYTIDENENFIEEKLGNLANLKDLSKNSNYEINTNVKLDTQVVGKNLDEIKGKTNKSELDIMIEMAKKASLNTNLYFQNEGATLIAFNEKNEKVIYTGATQTDNNASIIRAPKVALLKALSEGCRKFDKILVIKQGEKIFEELWLSYDVIQLFLQYTSLDFKILTMNHESNVKENTIKEVLPYPFEFEK